MWVAGNAGYTFSRTVIETFDFLSCVIYLCNMIQHKKNYEDKTLGLQCNRTETRNCRVKNEVKIISIIQKN